MLGKVSLADKDGKRVEATASKLCQCFGIQENIFSRKGTGTLPLFPRIIAFFPILSHVMKGYSLHNVVTGWLLFRSVTFIFTEGTTSVGVTVLKTVWMVKLLTC